MYFWRIQSLKQDLARELPSQRDQCGYALASALLYTAALMPLGYDGDGPVRFVDWVLYGISMVGVIVGVPYVYRANGGHSGRDFAVRYLSLGWVTSVRFIVVLMGCLLFAGGALAFLGPWDETWDRLLGLGMTLWVVLFYWRFGVHMRDVARGPQPAS